MSQRFRIGIGNLLMLTALVAVLVAWARDHHRLQSQLSEVANRSAAWSTAQACGPPDTPGYGDLRTAWASRKPDNQREWLLASFARPVVPNAIEIHETFNPGAVYKVTGFDRMGRETVLWTGVDPTPATAKRGISIIPCNTSMAFNQIKIYLDSPKIRGWNEIDAIGLRGKKGSTLWAEIVEASSSYGNHFVSRGWYTW